MDPDRLGLYLTFGGYLVLLLVIGYLADRRHSGSYEGFVAADKSLGGWTTALSSAASSESAWAMVGLSGLGYYFGLAAFWAVIGCVAGFALNGLFVVRQLRRSADEVGALTLSDYIAGRVRDDSRWVRVVSATIITFFMAIYVVAQFVAAGRILQGMEVLGPGTSYETAVAVGAAVLGLYVFLGGYAAVCWTDALQGALMVVAMVVLPLYALVLAGGPGPVLATLQQQAGAVGAGDLLAFGGAGFIFSQLAIGLGYQGMPHMVVRYITVKDDAAARRSAVISVVWGAVALSGAALLGIICRGLLPVGADGCHAEGLCATSLKAAENVLPFFTMQFLPPAGAGLVLAAVSAAIMSTADSQLMYAATSLVNDLIRPLFRRPLSRRALVSLTRVLIVALTVLAALAAMQEIKVIYSFVLFAWGALGAAFTPIVLLSLYWPGFSRRGALACLVAGPLSSILWHTETVRALVVGIDPQLYAGAFELIPGIIFSSLLGIAASKLWPIPERRFRTHN